MRLDITKSRLHRIDINKKEEGVFTEEERERSLSPTKRKKSRGYEKERDRIRETEGGEVQQN